MGEDDCHGNHGGISPMDGEDRSVPNAGPGRKCALLLRSGCTDACPAWRGLRDELRRMDRRASGHLQGGWADIESVLVRTPQGEEI